MTTLTVDFAKSHSLVKFEDATCNKPTVEGLRQVQAEQCAIEDYKALSGQIAEVKFVEDYEGNEYVAKDGEWFTVKVDAVSEDRIAGYIMDFTDDYLYPRYDIEVIDGKGILPTDRSLWIFGRSYRL